MTEQEMGGTYVFWQPTDSVGISTVDQQHKKLFSLINSLYTAMCTQQKHLAIEKVIGELVDYAEYHFKTEKSYLKELPNFATHEDQHVTFTTKALNFMEEFQSHPTESLLYEMISFLSTWLRSHIQGTDIQQFALLRQSRDLASTNSTKTPETL